MKPRKPIRRISSARAKQNAEYAKLKREWNKEHQRLCCVIGCPYVASKSPHHSRGRRGRLLCAVEYWKRICDFHHKMVHQHPHWARKLELLCLIGQWNVYPK